MADIQKLNVNNTTYDISTTWDKVTGKPSTFPPDSHTHSYLPLSGGTMTGAINLSNTNAKLAFGSLTTSPITGYKAPSLSSNGVGIYSRYGGSSDEGAIIVTEDTCVIYNSADTGWNFQVMDKDLGSDMTNDATRTFGVNQNHQAWSLSGFVKSGSSNNYVLLGGGDHKSISDFATAGHTHTKSQITDFPSSMPASDVYAWAKASTKPTYTYSEVGAAAASHNHDNVYSKKYSYSLPSQKCVKITYDGYTPVIISACRSNGRGQFLLAGLGYGEDGWTRNQFRCLIPSPYFTWKLSATALTVELYHNATSGDAIITVITTGNIIFTIANTLSGTEDTKRFACFDELTWNNITSKPTIPTNTNQLTNGAGFITGITKSMVTTALGYTPPTSDTNTWRPVTNTYTGSDQSTCVSQYGTNALYNALVNGYASSAGTSTYASRLGDSNSYYTKLSLDTALNGKANSSHGTHVTDGAQNWAGTKTFSSKIGFGVYGARFDSDVRSTWRNSIFGENTNNSFFRTVRTDKTITDFSEIYGSGISWSTSDTHGYLSVSYGATNGAWIGGGSGNGIGWSATLLHSGNYSTYAAPKSHTHTKSQITDFPSSLPASDVYSWAKASTKPTYNFGEIGPGIATIGDGANRLMFRTNASYASGVYYSTPGNEALVFANKYSVTSWIFANTDPTSQTAWTSLTPCMQIKNGKVVINKLIASGTDASYNLDVNGSANATTLYENGTRVALSGHTHNYAGSSSAGGAATSVVVTDSNANSTYRMVWHSGNSLYSTDNIYCNPSADYLYSKGFYQTSDERLKTFYDPIKVDLDKLFKLRKNYFKFNDKDKLEIGVSAQEIQSIYPEIVSENSDGYLSVAYDKLSVIALAAIDEQQNIINEQNNKINQLEERLKAIENILSKLTS